jgi:tRNA-2-methylthio-N6-dimethylallyladenosine synthase
VVAGQYVVRTFGCQMNEHDSQRIAGVLEALGFEQGDDPTNASVVVFNTCTIRENADERFFGQVNQLRATRREKEKNRLKEKDKK